MTVETADTPGLDKEALVKDLKRQVLDLEDDLRDRSETVDEFRERLEEEYRQAKEAKRIAAPFAAWRDERVTQAAAAWVLACVFVRFCEDNGLIGEPFIAGPGERLSEAEARHDLFFREHPHLNDRDWLIASFEHLAGTNPTAAGLFDENHNPLWSLTPSYDAATKLLTFWRRWGAAGVIRYDFTDAEWNTRFLGDLYQELSEHARKTYALLQTPTFVEEFILDLTLEPAVEEFGLNAPREDPLDPTGEPLRGLRTIDPACGSGHFLLGIFHRLFDKWRVAEPGTDDWTLIRRSLESVHGCDKNPFAASIARFRLLVAAMKVAGASRLDRAPSFPINVAVGDSLLHGRGAAGIQTDLDTLFAEFVVGREDGEAYAYATEDVWEYAKRADLLGRGSYHVVVGNPPYITVKDKQENENYRAAYKDVCAGTYALSVPFARRLFDLAVRGPGGRLGGGGFVGQITANSFMKREFGKKLIEVFFRNSAELSHVIDTSGAYIPGHGTPTVILVGRNRVPNPRRTLRAVLGVRGEPTQPVNAAEGAVWRAIVDQVGRPGSESDWVSVENAVAASFVTHPWSVSGGGAAELLAMLDASPGRLSARILETGRTTHTGLDDAYYLPKASARTRGISSGCVPVVLGDGLRDFRLSAPMQTYFPYSKSGEPRGLTRAEEVFLWPDRTALRRRVDFGQTPEERGLRWFDHSMFFPRRFRSPLSIAFAFVSTHNHFVLDRGGKVFNRSAPVIKLPEGADEDAHLELLGVLNSSTACFWLKQVSQDKGNRGGERSTGRYAWESFYEFTGTKLLEFPLPRELPLGLGRQLDVLARALAEQEPSAVCSNTIPDRPLLSEVKIEHDRIWRQMIALQEELDWQVYGLYGLLGGAELARTTASAALSEVPEVSLGERAFELAIAPRVATDEAVKQWFLRHGSTPVTELPAHWPEWYRKIVQARIDIITSRPKDIGLIERPECKRRWSAEPWEKKERAALRTWLLDRCESDELWYELRDGMKQPRSMTVNYLADRLSSDQHFVSVAALYASDHLGKPDLPLAQVLTEVVADEHVPYLAALRYKDSGLRTRAQWEEVWAEQRKEDKDGVRREIDPPSKYKTSDFLRTSYWTNRGKLDVPKERFISYPGASPDGDSTLMLGWAGWDHKDRAQVLSQLVDARTKGDGWGTERIVPLLAGFREVMPWVRQWHGEPDEEWDGDVPAKALEADFEALMRRHAVGDAQLTAWRPVKKTRGRKAAEPKKMAVEPVEPDEE
ncbi:BREX-2 system adenine-specific DNA-methyltransferase PglX [Streptomyces montanisoli]|uniref:site-specific DNA-methyltransferase (adenine-specific) n=1 Tax=Streptomyces montanisoli TaxID=2798581 RepID=A0A940M8P9_9ACTN|nr:BREX-2 system adenine-specific DNA-methyltransferase PglX [Streptomyces montanisoli]MBP0458324.1 BREX-2 system adenine-specific DNA-methyltransferase PglX [Streptomyces montanisoli]